MTDQTHPQDSFDVHVSALSLGELLYAYIRSLPPALRSTEIARLAFMAFESERGKEVKAYRKKQAAQRRLKASSPLVDQIGDAIRWLA